MKDKYKMPQDNFVSYNNHEPGCVCQKCGEARDLVKLIKQVCKVKPKQ